MRRVLVVSGAFGVSIVLLAIAACTGDDPAASSAGEYQQACRSDGTCSGALVCTQGVCLNPGEVPNDGGAASSSSGGGSSSGSTTSSGGSSSGGSSSGSSGADANPFPSCISPVKSTTGMKCGGGGAVCDAGDVCCESSATGTCDDSGASTACEGIQGLYLQCDGPAVCATRGGHCCMSGPNDAGATTFPLRDAGTVCPVAVTNALYSVCSYADPCPDSLQLCDKNDTVNPGCPATKTCTTIEVHVGSRKLLVDGCL